MTENGQEEAPQAAPRGKRVAEHIPPQYRNTKGTGFYPGGDARYKSDLINQALEYEEQTGNRDSEAHRTLTEGAFSHWASHLDKAREVRQGRSAKRAASAEKREAARKARDEAKAKRAANSSDQSGKAPSASMLLRELKTFVLKRKDVDWTWNDTEVYPIDVKVDQGEDDTLVQMVLVRDSNENEHWVGRQELVEHQKAA